MKKSTLTKLELDDYIITYDEKYSNITFQFKDKRNKKITLKHKNVETGELFYNFREFHGFMFLDKHDNFYDTHFKKCFINDNCIFIGDNDKDAFYLLKNHKKMEEIIKEGIEKMRNESNDDWKNKKEDNITNNLILELKKFDYKNIIFKNGIYTNIKRNNKHIITENLLKYYDEGKLIYEGDFFQFNEIGEYSGCYINFIYHGKGISNGYNNYKNCECEFFYDCRIGRGKTSNGLEKKFFFEELGFKGNIIEEKKNFSIYGASYIYDEYMSNITLQLNKVDNNNPGRILIRDRDKEIIYEINVKVNDELNPEGIGIVRDYRNGQILIVNFDTENILSNDLMELSLFLDREELNKNKNNDSFSDSEEINNISTDLSIEAIKNEEKLKPKEIFNDIIKDSIDKIDDVTNKLNEKIVEEKIKHLGIQDQKYAGECWVYALSELIYMSNARKYGRKLESFEEIYNKITTKYLKGGKTTQEIKDILTEILPEYDLSFEEVKDEKKLEDFIKRGIKCYASFGLNQIEWENFSEYFRDYSIKDEDKLLTKEILEKPIDNIENPNKIERHAVVLTDIDKDGNYVLVNSWGKYWNNHGIFKSRKECLKQSQFFAVYFYTKQLKKEEQESWENLTKLIENFLRGMKSIRCPNCKRSAKIDRYLVVDKNNFKCAYKNCRHVFEIQNDSDNFEFIVGQLMSYDLDKNINNKKLFDYGFV